MDNPKICVAFRFHVNFYHSYRGDTPDEKGFGKDIRIIRYIIKTLDDYNARGIDVQGTWDSENYFSLETIIPKHCPDILNDWKRRVGEGRDEFQLMSYNNGLVSSHTAKEFEDVISWSIANEQKSGIKDIFNDYYSMVRPQEMMFTPIHLKLYKKLGVDSISLFNSALPFNSFSNFIPKLNLVEKFNPLNLKYEGLEDSLTLLPAYNTGDLVDNISLYRWVTRVRKQQLDLDEPSDLLILIDMDADDDFWLGMDYPMVKRYYTTLKGLKGLVDSVCNLDYVEFTTPGKYMKDHPVVGEIEIRQDTADGSFDGMASWAEKWSNQRLWTGIERSRILELQARRLLKASGNQFLERSIDPLLNESYTSRIRSLSTTHFGLSSPIMNVTRLGVARTLVKNAVEKSGQALETLESNYLKREGDAYTFKILDYNRGISTENVSYNASPSKNLIRLKLNLDKEIPDSVCLKGEDGNPVPCSLVVNEVGQGVRKARLYFSDQFEPEVEKAYQLSFEDATEPDNQEGIQSIVTGDNQLKNEDIRCDFDDLNNLIGLNYKGFDFIKDTTIKSAVTYAKHCSEVTEWKALDFSQSGNELLGVKRLQAEIILKGAAGHKVKFKRQYKVAAGLPYLYLDVAMRYPVTPFQKYNKERAARLEKAWDGNWSEIMPCEIIPSFFGTESNHLRVWKNNYIGHVSSYDINYADFSKNDELDSFNNQITHGWVAVSDGEKGILIAQSADYLSSMAFCPMRTRLIDSKTYIHLNPFGSYHGKQFKYETAYTGLGKMAAYMTSDHLDPSAASYNGKNPSFTVMIAPYEGDEPPKEIQNDAMAFTYPYALVTDSPLIQKPAHRQWAM